MMRFISLYMFLSASSILPGLYDVNAFAFVRSLSSRTFSKWPICSSTPSSLLRRKSTSRDEDWRSFRARLVMMNDTLVLPTASDSWAYDAGLMVEKGSILVSRVESDVGCHDLHQPYYTKSIILLVEHEEDKFTQGIILNRPSNLLLDSENMDTVNGQKSAFEVSQPSHHPSKQREHHLRMLFGGDMENIYEDDPLIICLHNLTSNAAQRVSKRILPGLYLTSHLEARKLVKAGQAKADSFFTFSGSSRWGSGQIKKEVQRGSWYLASMDPSSLWGELTGLRRETYDPRRAGISMWRRLMRKLGKESIELAKANVLADRMLAEWSTQALTASQFTDDAAIFRAIQAFDQPAIKAGSLLRGSSIDECPFLMQDQYLHKSTLLVLSEDEKLSIGVVLNLPTTESHSIRINNSTIAEFPIRYGGPIEMKSECCSVDQLCQDGIDEEPFIWLHCCAGLKFMRIGKPMVHGYEHGVWTCTLDQVVQAIDLGFASADDFMLVRGVCVWGKAAGSGGVFGQVLSGNLEVVSTENIDGAWTTLRKQKCLNEHSLESNFNLMHQAWMKGAEESESLNLEADNAKLARHVYGSSTTIDELSDDALQAWIKIYLLGNKEYYRSN